MFSRLFSLVLGVENDPYVYCLKLRSTLYVLLLFNVCVFQDL